jgi:hypothetical protein
MGGSLSPKTPIPDTLTGRHLSQLDQMTQNFPKLWVLPFVLNPRQLDSPENPMTADLLRQLILVVEIRLLARLILSPKWTSSMSYARRLWLWPLNKTHPTSFQTPLLCIYTRGLKSERRIPLYKKCC